MAEKRNNGQRGSIGYGSSYRKGSQGDVGRKGDIDSVLGGQVWVIKPDKEAQDKTPCLWMQAGVVEFKDVQQFLRLRHLQIRPGHAHEGRKEANRSAGRMPCAKRPDMERVCRHSLTNRIAKRACAYDYQCATCDFDQFFEDVWTAKTKTLPREDPAASKGSTCRSDYYFHNGHTWARIESGGLSASDWTISP